MNRFRAASLALAGLLAACAGEDAGEARADANAACVGDAINVSQAWARAAQAGQPMSAAYLTLCNGGAGDDSLIGASMDGVGAVELHVTEMSDDGVASMKKTDEIPLPAGAPVALAPGGAHFMLIGVETAIDAANPPTLTLEFENAPPMPVTLDVRAAGETHH